MIYMFKIMEGRIDKIDKNENIVKDSNAQKR